MSRRLPVLEIFTKALSFLWEKRGFAAAIGWPVIVLSGLNGLSLDMRWFAGAGEGLATRVLAMDQFFTIVWVVEALLLAIVAVYWHRNILLQETKKPVLPIRVDGVVWRYVGHAILIFLVFIATALLLRFLAGAFKGTFLTTPVGSDLNANIAGLMRLVFAMVYVGAILTIVFRLSLALPAAAIGHKGFGLKSAWRATRGNSGQVLGLQILALLFGFGVAFIKAGLIKLMDAAFGATPYWAKLGLGTMVNLTYVLLGIGLLSLTYAYVIQDMRTQDVRMTE